MSSTLSEQIASAAPRTVFRFKDAAGRHYSAVKLSDTQLLEVKRAGVQVRVSHADPAAWLQTIPMGPVGMSTEPPAAALSAAERRRREQEGRLRMEGSPLPPVSGTDIEAMMGIMRRAKVKKGFALAYRSWEEDLTALEQSLARMRGTMSGATFTEYARGVLREKARIEGLIRANPGDSRAKNGWVVSWSVPRLFVVHDDGMKPISLCLIKMAGNYPYDYENQDVIVYDGCVGKTFTEAGVPLEEDGRPNIWYLPTGRGNKDPQKVFFA
jgi:hypothetical protein